MDTAMRTRRTLTRLLLSLCALALLAAPGAAAAKHHHHKASPKKQRPLYWGAWIGDQLTGEEPPWDMSAVSQFEGVVGKGLSLVALGSPFADCSSPPCNFFDFPA